ncbi:hypothetical protein CAEBREN_05520 [Caenorhabditis brenneri]|uniref:Uncharacterized protein n=1 Tax=Caenorhabditis brenneri TaxID=135651 RepID=G0P0N8_CAEBE|nr:hypothetical protein CAEBREN_05520 [Caenorhabditis brenneri]
MVNNEHTDMIRISAAKPHLRKSVTDTVARKVYGVIKVEDPIKVEGVLLNKPKIVFAGNKAASLPNSRGVPTDFNRAGNYAIAKELRNWEVVFNKKEEVVDGSVDNLRQEMKDSGMNALAPTITLIGQGSQPSTSLLCHPKRLPQPPKDQSSRAEI